MGSGHAALHDPAATVVAQVGPGVAPALHPGPACRRYRRVCRDLRPLNPRDRHSPRSALQAQCPVATSAGASDHGVGLPSTVFGSINSVRVPSGSNRFNWRRRFFPTCISSGLVYIVRYGRGETGTEVKPGTENRGQTGDGDLKARFPPPETYLPLLRKRLVSACQLFPASAAAVAAVPGRGRRLARP